MQAVVLDAPIIPGECAAGVELGQLVGPIINRQTPDESNVRRALTDPLAVAIEYRFGPVSLFTSSGRVNEVSVSQGYAGRLADVVTVGQMVTDVERLLGVSIPYSGGDDVIMLPSLPGCRFDLEPYTWGADKSERAIEAIVVFRPTDEPDV